MEKRKKPQENKSESVKTKAGWNNVSEVFALICGLALASGYWVSFIEEVPDWASLLFYTIACLIGGFFVAKLTR